MWELLTLDRPGGFLSKRYAQHVPSRRPTARASPPLYFTFYTARSCHLADRALYRSKTLLSFLRERPRSALLHPLYSPPYLSRHPCAVLRPTQYSRSYYHVCCVCVGMCCVWVYVWRTLIGEQSHRTALGWLVVTRGCWLLYLRRRRRRRYRATEGRLRCHAVVKLSPTEPGYDRDTTTARPSGE